MNPARSLGPALFAGGAALADYWVYLIGPAIGAVIAARALRTAARRRRTRARRSKRLVLCPGRNRARRAGDVPGTRHKPEGTMKTRLAIFSDVHANLPALCRSLPNTSAMATTTAFTASATSAATPLSPTKSKNSLGRWSARLCLATTTRASASRETIAAATTSSPSTSK